tara:strand:- start:242 stop:550 length:309 start_codon:yes stop_codon:yes gene_type:complete
LIFFNGCEDEKDDRPMDFPSLPSYLNLKSFSFKMPNGDGDLIWVGWGTDGHPPPYGHLQIRISDWIHLYEDEEYVEAYDSSSIEPLHRMELEGIEYSYELMD